MKRSHVFSASLQTTAKLKHMKSLSCCFIVYVCVVANSTDASVLWSSELSQILYQARLEDAAVIVIIEEVTVILFVLSLSSPLTRNYKTCAHAFSSLSIISPCLIFQL